MKKPFAILFGFFGLAMLDAIFSYASPVDFTCQRLSVLWHFFFIGVLVFVRDKPWLNRLLIGALAGLVSDFFFTDSFPCCFLLYGAAAWFCGAFSNRMEGNGFAFSMYMLCCLLVDILPWLWTKWTGLNNMPLISWMYHMELLSVLINGLVIILIMYIDMVMDRFYLMEKNRQNRRQRRRNQAVVSSAIPNANHPQTQ